MEPVNKYGEVSFHGIDYFIRILANNDSLSIEIEQKNNGDTWRNNFSNEYIEEITQKTGNFKKFPIFVKMLITSISKNSDSVFLDILTYQDLQVLKTRKQGTASTPNQNTQSQNTSIINNKRYLILTYLVEFDKVHYPLPLNFNDSPDVESLKNTIRRLRTEIEEMGKVNKIGGSTGNSFFSAQEKDNKENQIASLKLENEYLKAKLKKNEEESYQKKGAVEYDMIIKGKQELENEVETLKSCHIKEISKLNSTIEDLQKELQLKKAELLRLQIDFAQGLEHSDPHKRLTDHIIKMNEESESELFSAKKTMNKQVKDLEKVQQELEMYKQNDKKQKIRIKQLEMDLESALKKTSVKGVTDRLYSGGSRGNSPALSSKRSVSVPHRGGFSNDKKNFDRKNSSHLSAASNKGKYSRENSVTSDSGYLNRWKRKASPDTSKLKKSVTPQRKLTGSSGNSLKQKNYVFNRSPKTINTNTKINNSNNLKKKSEINNKQGNSGKKDYEKPWTVNSKIKTTSPLPKINNTRNTNKNMNSGKKSLQDHSDDENALFKKLEELRNKNKKDEFQNKATSSKEQTRSYGKNENKENAENIDERLNKLQNLLKIAKK